VGKVRYLIVLCTSRKNELNKKPPSAFAKDGQYYGSN